MLRLLHEEDTVTITFDMRKIEAALWKSFQTTAAQNAKRREPACDIVQDIVQQCVAGGDVEELTDALINGYEPDVDLVPEDNRVATMRIRRLLRMFRILYRLLMRCLAEMSRSSTGRISNRDTIYRAVLAAIPTPPTVAFAMGGAI